MTETSICLFSVLHYLGVKQTCKIYFIFMIFITCIKLADIAILNKPIYIYNVCVSVIHYIPDLKRLEHELVKFDTRNYISIYKVIAQIMCIVLQ